MLPFLPLQSCKVRLCSSIRWATGASVVIFTFNKVITFYKGSDCQLHLDIIVFCWKQWLLSVESTAVTVIRLSLTWSLLFGTDGLSGLSYNLKTWSLVMEKPWEKMEVGVLRMGVLYTYIKTCSYEQCLRSASLDWHPNQNEIDKFAFVFSRRWFLSVSAVYHPFQSSLRILLLVLFWENMWPGYICMVFSPATQIVEKLVL